MQEQIIRKVTNIGNGAHIFAPKDWINDEVLLVRVPKPNLKEEILKILEPYLENIIAVFLFGSYARKEHDEKSDIDVLVIADKKIEIKKRERFHFTIVEKDKIEKVIKTNPIFFFSLIRESKPIINSSFFKNFQEQKLDLRYFKEFIESSERMIKMNRGFIELDRLEEGAILDSESVIYSIILRLRGVFLIKTLMKKQHYSATAFKKWLRKNVKGIEYEKIYEIYRAIRDRKKTKEKVRIEDTEKLVAFLEKEIAKLKRKIKK